MEPTQPIAQEKEKLPEIRKPATPRGVVFPILIVLAMLFFAGALFFSLRTQESDIVPPDADIQQTADTKEMPTGVSDVVQTAPRLHLLSPKGGESLCIGDDYAIQWEGPKELSTVSLWIQKGINAAWSIETFPATFNESNTPGKGEYVWEVGTSERGAIPAGYAYTLGISGNYPQSMHKTNDYFQTDKPFSIINCQG